MFGKRLAFLRKQKSISQYKLAELLKLTRGQIANYEQGKRQPDYETLKMFADFFSVSTDYLLGKSDDPKLRQITDPEMLKEFEEAQKAMNDAFALLAKLMEKHKKEISPS